MRLFIAVNFSDEVKARIIAVQEKLRSQALRGNFSRPENLHLTLAFLGETPEEKLPLIIQIMEKIKPNPFEISFNRTGSFTHSRKELWWIGADPGCAALPELKALHAELLEALQYEGFSVDKRPFNAHISLGREIKHSLPIILDSLEIKLKVDRISLMKSEHLRGILTYTEIFGKDL